MDVKDTTVCSGIVAEGWRLLTQERALPKAVACKKKCGKLGVSLPHKVAAFIEFWYPVQAVAQAGERSQRKINTEAIIAITIPIPVHRARLGNISDSWLTLSFTFS